MPRNRIIAAFLSVSLCLAGLFAGGGASAQRTLTVAEIQGGGNVSQYDNQSVTTSGIVTARTRTGFFIQTPDDKADTDPATSEGIFVYTRNEPAADAALGNLVTVTGMVEEFRPRSETNTLPLTELSFRQDRDTIRVVSKGNALPKPVVLTAENFKGNKIDQLEMFEGMRVHVNELAVAAPTNGRVDIKTASSESNGTFFGVVKGIARPFREPGLEISDYVFLGEKDKEKFKKDLPKVTLYDGNPERLRVESTAQLGSQPLDVSSYAEIKNLTGVLHYSYRTYTLFPDADGKPAVSNLIKAKPLPETNPRQFSVAAINLENFFDDKDDPEIKEDIVTPEGFERRLKKISGAVRDHMRMPDVVGIIEAENLAGLKRLAERINADAAAVGKADPKYEAYLVEGNDGRGIDNGYLVKSSRVKVLETKQLGKDDRYKNPNTKEDNFLNDRPPLMLRASVQDPKTGQPFEFTTIVNHMKSFNGYNDPKQMDNVRAKKRLQAEYLARVVQERQKANPAERIVLIGDFNTYQFNDGIVDMMGTITGKPAPPGAVINPSEDLVNPDLINLVEVIKPAERYSYLFDGNAQVLDHIIISESFKKHINGFGYARINVDFPETLRNDDSRVERFSDHDAAVAYFTFDDVTAAGSR